MLDVELPSEPKPFINWCHIDGPMIVCTNGVVSWLSWLDILFHVFGFRDLRSLEVKHRRRR